MRDREEQLRAQRDGTPVARTVHRTVRPGAAHPSAPPGEPGAPALTAEADAAAGREPPHGRGPAAGTMAGP